MVWVSTQKRSEEKALQQRTDVDAEATVEDCGALDTRLPNHDKGRLHRVRVLAVEGARAHAQSGQQPKKKREREDGERNAEEAHTGNLNQNVRQSMPWLFLYRCRSCSSGE